MTDNQPTLAACPFCGGEADKPKRRAWGRGAYYVVFCGNDSCNAGGPNSGDTKQEAIDAWNTRPDEAVIKELVAYCGNLRKYVANGQEGSMSHSSHEDWLNEVDDILARLPERLKE